jgi:hypothetical protein
LIDFEFLKINKGGGFLAGDLPVSTSSNYNNNNNNNNNNYRDYDDDYYALLGLWWLTDGLVLRTVMPANKIDASTLNG